MLEKFELQFASKVTEFSEYKNYYEIKNRVCYYDAPNGNNVILPYDDTSLAKAQSLVDMPVQAKYTVNQDGNPDLKDHCVAYDDEGNMTFLTASVGVHTGVEIKEDTVTTFAGETKTLPCLFATAKIWKRYPNYCAAIKRLYDEDELHNSWEVSSFSYSYDNGMKTLNDYIFDANCYLGSLYQPAYGDSAKVLELSSMNGEMMIASALSRDLIEAESSCELTGKEEDDLENEIIEVVSEVENPIEVSEVEVQTTDSAELIVNTETVEEVEPEVEDPQAEEISMLTVCDLYDKVGKACKEAYGKWCYVSYLFPADNVCWCYYEEAESELDYLLFNYTVEGDEVSVSEPQKVRLSVSVASINNVLEEKNNIIADANAQIEKMNDEIKNLLPFKAAHDEAEAKRVEDERASRVLELKKYAEDSKCFSAEELDGEELSSMFEALDVNGIKSVISDRIVSKLRQPDVEVSAVREETVSVSSELCLDEPVFDYASVIRAYLYD